MMSFFFKAAAITSLAWLGNVNSFSPTIPIGRLGGKVGGTFGTTSLSVSSTDRDFYEILGITPYTNSKEIKQAFRKLAKEYHPGAYRRSVTTACLVLIDFLSQEDLG
jgi:hypothetical protein